MIALSVDADIPAEANLLGKSVSDLQENITISENAVSGSLKYVTGYTGFSGDAELQSGNFLAVHAEAENADSIYAELIGGESGPVQLDADGIVVFRIADKDTQAVKLTTYKGSASESVELSIAGLTVATE